MKYLILYTNEETQKSVVFDLDVDGESCKVLDGDIKRNRFIKPEFFQKAKVKADAAVFGQNKVAVMLISMFFDWINGKNKNKWRNVKLNGVFELERI